MWYSIYQEPQPLVRAIPNPAAPQPRSQATPRTSQPPARATPASASPASAATQPRGPVNLPPAQPRRPHPRRPHPSLTQPLARATPLQRLVRATPRPLLLPLLPCTPLRRSSSLRTTALSIHGHRSGRHWRFSCVFPLHKAELRPGLQTRHVPTVTDG